MRCADLLRARRQSRIDQTALSVLLWPYCDPSLSAAATTIIDFDWLFWSICNLVGDDEKSAGGVKFTQISHTDTILKLTVILEISPTMNAHTWNYLVGFLFWQ